jgi:hypothetical protein
LYLNLGNAVQAQRRSYLDRLSPASKRHRAFSRPTELKSRMIPSLDYILRLPEIGQRCPGLRHPRKTKRVRYDANDFTCNSVLPSPFCSSIFGDEPNFDFQRRSLISITGAAPGTSSALS